MEVVRVWPGYETVWVGGRDHPGSVRGEERRGQQRTKNWFLRQSVLPEGREMTSDPQR